ncbi:hypothetical protein F7734_46010 [Scytonema sp. UIC 10036]|uniref:hypothetical protein n=1 Tax=Scytonema sp. UIC 10036 TaxID=2304196 RepID=UPI0012DA6196|nr:hypothetical protein [Scytonema sp. UIC 10036]MUG99260.1 hypothetical protein [Scytonema sp. UIC 10036]
MDSLSADNKSKFLEDLQLPLYNSEADKNSDINVLFNTLEFLEKTIEILETFFAKVNQTDRTVVQLENSKQKDSQVIESTALNSAERPEIENRLELVCEQVETLKQLLYDKEIELQEMRQELQDTNMDLCLALNSPWLSLDEAKELVKKLLASKKSNNEILAELLSTICNSTVKPSELEHREISNSIKPLISQSANYKLTNNKGILTEIIALRKKAFETRAKSKILREQSRAIQAQCRELRSQVIEQGIKFVGSQASFTARQPNFRYRRKPKKIHRAD